MGFHPVAVFYNKTQHTNNTHHTNNTPHSNKHSTQNYTNNKGHTTHNECNANTNTSTTNTYFKLISSLFQAYFFSFHLVHLSILYIFAGSLV
jgi:hypothetical protein